MKYIYKISRDIDKDAWNWWNAANGFSHGVQWKEQIPDEILEHVLGKTRDEAYAYLIPFLKRKYVDEKSVIDEFKKFVNKEYQQKFNLGCAKMVMVMGRELYRADFLFYLTTLRRSPYNKHTGAVWLSIYRHDPMGTFLHELCHFQFIHYWRENPSSLVSKLTNDQFEFLKESLTMILDEDFLPIIEKNDTGYDLHIDLRKELTKFWTTEKDFNKLVDFGVKQVVNYL